MESQKKETMGDDTKRYLASFINDLRSKSTAEQTAQNSRTPPPTQTGPQDRPMLFKGSLTQESHNSNAPTTRPPTVGTEKECRDVNLFQNCIK